LKKLTNVNQQYGYWTVLGKSSPNIVKSDKTHWRCRCVCNSILHVRADSVTSGKSKSCGCRRSEDLSKLEGQKFNSWKILSIGIIRNTHRYAMCRCDCGRVAEARLSAVRNGASKSCGCTRKGGRTILHDLVGEEFGHLVALDVHHTHPRRGAFWRCLCKVCGQHTVVQRSNLINGTTSSCGCRKGLGRKVAELAGCAPSLVSVVMHNKWREKKQVTEELAAKIKQIAKDVGYKPWYNLTR
jgi:hypothetical protein